MKSRKKRSKGRKGDRAFSFFLLVPLVILAGILFYSNWKVAKERRELAEKRGYLAERVEALKTENERLERGLSESESEDYWEERIREQGYKKPGEDVVVIKRQESGETVSSPDEKEQSFWHSFLAEIWSVF